MHRLSLLSILLLITTTVSGCRKLLAVPTPVRYRMTVYVEERGRLLSGSQVWERADRAPFWDRERSSVVGRTYGDAIPIRTARGILLFLPSGSVGPEVFWPDESATLAMQGSSEPLLSYLAQRNIRSAVSTCRYFAVRKRTRYDPGERCLAMAFTASPTKASGFEQVTAVQLGGKRYGSLKLVKMVVTLTDEPVTRSTLEREVPAVRDILTEYNAGDRLFDPYAPFVGMRL